MVRMSRVARKKAFDKDNKLLNIHCFFLVVAAIVIVSVSSYFYLVDLEERNNRPEDRVLENNNIRSSDTNMSPQMKVASTLAKGSAASVVSARQPFIVYGTAWKKERTAELVEQAVKAGFRFIDTACQPKHYNEAGVGEGWTNAAKELNLDRRDIFLQTKFTSLDGQDPNNIPYDKTLPLEEQVKQSLDVSLTNLKTTYLDSLVMHSPEPTVEDTMRVYRTMESFVEDGRVKRLGISNCYDYEKFTTIYEQAKVKPSVLQNRLYEDSNFDTELRQFCKEKGIWYQSFWTLTANRHALATDAARDWAAKKSLNPQTLMFAFLMQLGYITPLSGTTSLTHMQEDVAVMHRLQDGEKIFENDEELRRFEKLLGMP